MDLFSLVFLCLLIGVIICVFLRYLISINRDFAQETNKCSKQKNVQGNMEFYRCENEGESLNDCEIYPVPYDVIGYKDVI